MLTAVAKGEISITDYVRLSSAAPARLGTLSAQGRSYCLVPMPISLSSISGRSKVDQALCTPPAPG